MKTHEKGVKSQGTPFWSPHGSGTAQPSLVATRMPGPPAWSRHSPSRQGSPGGSLTCPLMAPSGAWWHQRQLLTHLGFASSAPTHSAAARPGLGLVRADPAPWQPQPIGVAGWGLHASRPSAVGGWAVCLPALAAAAAAGVPRNRCWIREVEKHRRAPQGKGIPRSVEAAKPTLGKFSKGCAEDSF